MESKPKKYIYMKDGRKLEKTDSVIYYIKNGGLYVYTPTFTGARYMYCGEVEKEDE